MEVSKVSSESLQKAMETLGLIEKAEVVATTTGTAAVNTATIVAEVKNEELEKAEKDLAELQAKIENIKNPKTEKEVIVKAEVNNSFNSEELIKGLTQGFEDKIGAMATLVQSKDQKIEELTKAVNSVNEFSKALAAKLGMIEKTPLDRKSVSTVGYVEKFEKAEGAVDKSVRTLSISNGKHRSEIAEELFKAATANPDKVDAELEKAVQSVELRQVTPQLQQRLLKDFKIQVVR